MKMSNNDRRLNISRISDSEMEIWKSLKHLELDGLINITEEIEIRIKKLISDNKQQISNYLNDLQNDLESINYE